MNSSLVIMYLQGLEVKKAQEKQAEYSQIHPSSSAPQLISKMKCTQLCIHNKTVLEAVVIMDERNKNAKADEKITNKC